MFFRLFLKVTQINYVIEIFFTPIRYCTVTGHSPVLVLSIQSKTWSSFYSSLITGLWLHLEGRKYGPLDFKSTLRFIFLIILTDNGTLSPSTTSTSNGQSLSSAFKIVPQKTDLPSSTTGKILDLNKSIKWDENVDCNGFSCNENNRDFPVCSFS